MSREAYNRVVCSVHVQQSDQAHMRGEPFYLNFACPKMVFAHAILFDVL